MESDNSTSQHFYGKWILESNYDAKSNIHVSIMWHKLKAMIEDHTLPAIKMECPAPKNKTARPEIYISTSQDHMFSVGRKIASIVQHNLLYVIGEGSFPGDRKTLYWNNGNPSYEDSSRARSGIIGNWRSK